MLLAKEFAKIKMQSQHANTALVVRYRRAQTNMGRLFFYGRLTHSLLHLLNYFFHENRRYPLCGGKTFSHINVPLSFIDRDEDILSSRDAFDCSLYFLIETALQDSYERLVQPDKPNIMSKFSMMVLENGTKKSIDLSYQYPLIYSCFVRLLLANKLNMAGGVLKEIRKTFIRGLHLGDEYYFSHYDTEFDVTISPERFIQIYSRYGDLALLKFFNPIKYSPLYKAQWKLLEKKTKELYADRASVLRKNRLIDRMTREIIAFGDRSNLHVGHPGKVNLGLDSPILPRGRKLDDLAMLDVFRLDQIMNEGYRQTFVINGQGVEVELKPALHQISAMEYDLIKQETQHIVKPISKKLLEFNNQSNGKKTISHFEKTGGMDIENWYRRDFDGLVFQQEYTTITLRTKLKLVFLIDNSISISPEKQKFIKQIGTTLIEVARAFPQNFPQIIAYAQHSSGNKKVTLHHLADVRTESLSNPSKLLHLDRSGVNYDMYAARVVVDLHKDQLKEGKTMFILLGDSWPIGLKEDVKVESRKIIQSIKKDFPNLILTYLATNKQYDPLLLGFDHYIEISSSDSVNEFAKYFIKMIEEIHNTQNHDHTAA